MTPIAASQLAGSGVSITQQPSKVEKAEVRTKVSGKSIPNFSFTGDMTASSIRAAAQNQQIPEYDLAPDTPQTESLIKQSWSSIIQYFENLGKIRISAALSHSKFKGNKILLTVANKAIEQEIVDIKTDILDKVFAISQVRAGLDIMISEDTIRVNKPVSDSQRLAAMMEHNASVKNLCNELKLRL